MPKEKTFKIQTELDQLMQAPVQINSEPRFKVQVKKNVFPDNFTLVLSLEMPKGFKFKSGQYVWLVLPQRSKSNGLVDRRAYSISSSPESENLEFIIRLTESDYIKAISRLKKGEDVEIIGPMGASFIPPKEGAIMISGGVGVAPFLSVFREKPGGQNELYAFEAEGRPLYCKKELIKLQKKPGYLVYIKQNAPDAVQLKNLSKNFDSRPIFISGPEVFVTAVAQILNQLGVDPKRFCFEAFYPKYQPGEEILEVFEHIDDSGKVFMDSLATVIYQKEEKSQEKIQKDQIVHRIFTPIFLGVIIFFSFILGLQYFRETHGFPWFPFVCVACFGLIGIIYRKILYQDRVGKIITIVCFVFLIGSRLMPVIDNLMEPWLIIFPLVAGKFLKPKNALWYSGAFIIVFILVTFLGAKNLLYFQAFDQSVLQYVFAISFIAIITQVFSRREELYDQVLRTQIISRNQMLANVKQFLKLSEMFVQISQQTSNHVVLTDHNGRILYANKAAELLTGYSFKEMRWQTPRLWGGLMAKEYYQALWERKSRGEIVTHELVNRRRNGSLYTALGRVTPIVKEGRVVAYVATEEDISRLKEIDKAKTEFVSLASHQLRTPLSAINWYAEMLLAGDAGKLNDEQKKYLKEVYAGNQRMVDLVNALLNVSRLDLGTFMIEPEAVSVAEIAESVLKELGPLISQKNITVTKEFEPNLPSFLADAKLLRMVIQNLLSNAVKYSSDKGSVATEVRVVKKNGIFGNKKVGVDSLGISVRDKGMGVPLRQQDKIFSKLFRADNAMETETEGTGLGLYIVKSIIDQSGGEIWFVSKQDEGTEFYVVFPLSGMKGKEGSKKLD